MSRFLPLLLLPVVLLFGTRDTTAQELACSVSVDFKLLTDQKYTYLRGFESDVEEYLNQYSWTDDAYMDHERIDCSMTISFMEGDGDNFNTSLVVVSRRPIYGTTQSSTVIRFNDESWNFSYTQGAPLIHDPNGVDPITSVLDFYANLILGYDYDTFSELGGTPYFERARAIAEKARARGASGWSEVGSDRGRADIVSQLLDARFEPLRRAYFTYHYHGLDRFVSKTEESRAAMLEVLQNIDELYQQLSRQYTIDLFFSAKNTELAAIFEESNVSGDAFELLTGLDPSNSSVYQRLIQ